MPIYAYKCASCGFAKDVLQKMSDAPLTTCPSCGEAAFSKQVTAAGFQLKGSGWYVTDFRGGNNNGGKPADDGKAGDAAPAEGGKGDKGDKGAGKGDAAAPAKADTSAGKPEAAKPAAPAAAPATKAASSPSTGSAG